MKFTKMHGIGNDYVYVNCFEENVADPSAVAKFVSDRHFGIGSDGLILIKPSGTIWTGPRALCAATESAVWQNTSMTTGS